jgi:hypothetical protein
MLLTATLLALCTGCSDDPGYFCGGSASPGVMALFDLSSMVFSDDQLTDIQICDTYGCQKGDLTGQTEAINTSPSIPYDSTTFVITNLTVTVYYHDRIIRTARAPGPIAVLKPEQIDDPCAYGGVEVRYNRWTKGLESKRLSEPDTVNSLPESTLTDVPAVEPSGSPTAVPQMRRQFGGPPPMIDGPATSTGTR